jgi:hypothetical protein
MAMPMAMRMLIQTLMPTRTRMPMPIPMRTTTLTMMRIQTTTQMPMQTPMGTSLANTSVSLTARPGEGRCTTIKPVQETSAL